jgi:photosystem II stability/assembly factor-like uncharacterized protein
MAQDSKIDGGVEFDGLWGTNDDNVFAAGQGYIVHTQDQGHTWSLEHSSNPVLLGVWGSGPGDIYAVGIGAIAHTTDSGLTWPTELETLPGNGDALPTLLGIWGSGADDIYVVGESGTILHRS